MAVSRVPDWQTVRRPGVVRAADMVAGHVGLDISCLDRLYLSGFVPKLQTGGGVRYFLHEHRGKPIVSPALFRPMGEKFRQAVDGWAEANHIPVVDLRDAERNIEVMTPYLEAAARAGRSRVVAVGTTQEYQYVWTARKRERGPDGPPQFSFSREKRPVKCFYFYLFDDQLGPGFIKICSYFPYPVKVWLNGHEWAKQQARKIGLAFTALSNGFAACDDPALLQSICDGLRPAHVQAWFQRWMKRIPLPLEDADRAAGYWWELSMRQVETSRTLVFDQDVHARAFFESLLCENMDLGRPENVELLFRRGQPGGRPAGPPARGGYKTKIDRNCELITLNVFHRKSRLKQYLKDGVALRIETVINDPRDLNCNRMLANLPQLQHKTRAINDRLLHTEAVGQDTTLVSPVIERITRPTLTRDGRKAPALRFGDLRVQALAGATAALLLAVTGITNRSLRALMTGLLNRPYSMNQASYDLARLCRNDLITRIPGRNMYTLTPDGLVFAHFYTKVYDHLLRPLMAPDRPNAPPEITAALATLDQAVADSIHRARLPARLPDPTPGKPARKRKTTASKLRTNANVLAPEVP